MADATLTPLTDYGLGTYQGKPLVLMPNTGRCYHLHNHNGRISGTAFTEDFCRNHMLLRPCKTCFRMTGDCEHDCQERCAYPGQFSECHQGTVER